MRNNGRVRDRGRKIRDLDGLGEILSSIGYELVSNSLGVDVRRVKYDGDAKVNLVLMSRGSGIHTGDFFMNNWSSDWDLVEAKKIRDDICAVVGAMERISELK
jgi:hypothetical protein